VVAPAVAASPSSKAGPTSAAVHKKRPVAADADGPEEAAAGADEIEAETGETDEPAAAAPKHRSHGSLLFGNQGSKAKPKSVAAAAEEEDEAEQPGVDVVESTSTSQHRVNLDKVPLSDLAGAAQHAASARGGKARFQAGISKEAADLIAPKPKAGAGAANGGAVAGKKTRVTQYRDEYQDILNKVLATAEKDAAARKQQAEADANLEPTVKKPRSGVNEAGAGAAAEAADTADGPDAGLDSHAAALLSARSLGALREAEAEAEVGAPAIVGDAAPAKPLSEQDKREAERRAMLAEASAALAHPPGAILDVLPDVVKSSRAAAEEKQVNQQKSILLSELEETGVIGSRPAPAPAAAPAAAAKPAVDPLKAAIDALPAAEEAAAVAAHRSRSEPMSVGEPEPIVRLPVKPLKPRATSGGGAGAANSKAMPRKLATESEPLLGLREGVPPPAPAAKPALLEGEPEPAAHPQAVTDNTIIDTSSTDTTTMHHSAGGKAGGGFRRPGPGPEVMDLPKALHVETEADNTGLHVKQRPRPKLPAAGGRRLLSIVDEAANGTSLGFESHPGRRLLALRNSVATKSSASPTPTRDPTTQEARAEYRASRGRSGAGFVPWKELRPVPKLTPAGV
jgi:hypothetical protein